MDENFWKDAYQDAWVPSSEREKRLAKYLFEVTEKNCCLWVWALSLHNIFQEAPAEMDTKRATRIL